MNGAPTPARRSRLQSIIEQSIADDGVEFGEFGELADGADDQAYEAFEAARAADVADLADD